MANAQIAFTQGSSSAGSGYAMLGVTGTSVIVSNGDDSDVVGWMFEVLDVGLGSAVEQGIVQEGETPTWTFDPDATGCYVLRLTTQDRQGNLYEDVRVFGVLESNGLLIPSFMADAAACNFVIGGVTNEKGWSPFVNAWLKIVEENGGGSAPWTQDCSTGGTIAYSQLAINRTAEFLGRFGLRCQMARGSRQWSTRARRAPPSRTATATDG